MTEGKPKDFHHQFEEDWDGIAQNGHNRRARPIDACLNLVAFKRHNHLPRRGKVECIPHEACNDSLKLARTQRADLRIVRARLNSIRRLLTLVSRALHLAAPQATDCEAKTCILF